MPLFVNIPSTISSNLKPPITDDGVDEMESSMENGYIDGLDPALLDPSAPDGTRDLEELFLQSSEPAQPSYLAPSELTRNKNVKKPSTDAAVNPASYPSDAQSYSPADSSHASSADSPACHLRNTSLNSNHSGVFSPGSVDAKSFQTNGWSNGGDIAVNHDGYFGQNGDASFLKTDFSVDGDIELSNKAMDSAFVFDSAASSPSPLKMDSAAESTAKSPLSQASLPSSTQPKDGPNSSQVLLKFHFTFFYFAHPLIPVRLSLFLLPLSCSRPHAPLPACLPQTKSHLPTTWMVSLHLKPRIRVMQ